MKVMKHHIIELKAQTYQGFKTEVDVDHIKQTDFEALWNKIDRDTFNAIKKEEDYFIGYEDYTTMSDNHRKFTYYALAPSAYFDEDAEEKVNIEAGHYILFDSLFKTHGPETFAKVYHYIDNHNISVDRRFDLELIPVCLDCSKDDAVIYIALKLK